MREEERRYKKVSEYQTYLGKLVRLVLINNFFYTGKVINVAEDSLTIIDKFSSSVTIRLNTIISISDVNNGVLK